MFRASKMFLFFAVCSVFVLTVFMVAYANNQQVRMYGVKSGVLETEVAIVTSGKTSKIREVTVWDDWGLKLAKYQIVPDGGTKNIIFYKHVDGRLQMDHAYLVKLKDMSYEAVSKMPSQGALSKVDAQSSVPAAEAMMMFSGSKKNGQTREWSGYTCEEWVHPIGNVNCLWNGVIMYTDMGVKDVYETHKSPVSLNLDDVDPKHFEVPGLAQPD